MKSSSKNCYYKLPILDGLELLQANHHKQNFPFHIHSTFNISLVIEQAFSTKLPNRSLQAPTGAIVITNPGEVHATFCDNKTGSSFFTYYVSPDVLQSINRQRPVFFEQKIIMDDSLFRRLYMLCQNNSTDYVYWEQELLSVLKQLIAGYATGSLTSGPERKLFRQFLEEESFEKFSLEKTAQKFGLDKYKFLRLFKQETGLTPNNYIILKRVEKSKELLQTHGDLLDIAIQTGFYDATHLCKHFKRITGITPQAYRNA